MKENTYNPFNCNKCSNVECKEWKTNLPKLRGTCKHRPIRETKFKLVDCISRPIR